VQNEQIEAAYVQKIPRPGKIGVDIIFWDIILSLKKERNKCLKH